MLTGSAAPTSIKCDFICQDDKNGPALFNCTLINACSIVNKIDNLALVIEAQSIDIVLITESRLGDSIVDSFLINAVSESCNQFRCFRKDRNRQGGGVCMLIRSCIKTMGTMGTTLLWFLQDLHMELVAVDILNS